MTSQHTLLFLVGLPITSSAQTENAVSVATKAIEEGGLWGIAAVLVAVLAAIGAWAVVKSVGLKAAEREKEREAIVTLTVSAVTATEKQTEKLDRLTEYLNDRTNRLEQDHRDIVQEIRGRSVHV